MHLSLFFKETDHHDKELRGETEIGILRCVTVLAALHFYRVQWCYMKFNNLKFKLMVFLVRNQDHISCIKLDIIYCYFQNGISVGILCVNPVLPFLPIL